MKNINSFYALSSVVFASLLLWSCQSGGDFQGREYMPDMAHSIAYEANHDLYYYQNTWGTKEEYRALAGPRKPVYGTVARGYKPYKYDLDQYKSTKNKTELRDSLYTIAIGDASINNPLAPNTKEELEKILSHGAEVYNISCAVCHGEAGDGNGSIYNGGNGPYSAAPANYLKEEFIKAADARYYNAIVHGKGQMQSHSDKMNEEERWEVIHYIRYLQAEDKGEDYYAKMGVSNESTEESFTKVMDALNAPAEEGEEAVAKPTSFKLNNVLYQSGKARLMKSSYATLNQLVSVLKKNNAVSIEIGGHTDNTGEAASNVVLSDDRAHTVYDFLVSKGISADRLSYKGYGDAKPIASNATIIGRKLNRRTEVKIVQ